jgi:hypothetical protein
LANASARRRAASAAADIKHLHAVRKASSLQEVFGSAFEECALIGEASRLLVRITERVVLWIAHHIELNVTRPGASFVARALIITRDGIDRVLPVRLNEEASRALQKSADVLRRHLRTLDIPT